MIKKYTRVAVAINELGQQRVSKSLIDQFATPSSNYILEADVLETGMVGYYLAFGVRKVNAWRLKKK